MKSLFCENWLNTPQIWSWKNYRRHKNRANLEPTKYFGQKLTPTAKIVVKNKNKIENSWNKRRAQTWREATRSSHPDTPGKPSTK